MKTKLFISIILFAVGITTNAQTSKESANTRILNEFANKLDNYNIYVHSTSLNANDTIFLKDGSFIINPYQSSWCYFIDETPAAGWVHPCKYYIIDINSNSATIVDKDIYPKNYNNFEVLSTLDMNNTTTWTGVPDTTYNKINRMAPDEHQWALLISSFDGDDSKRFWGDLSCVYTVLTNRFGFIENQEDTNETWKYFNHISVVAPKVVSYCGTDLNNSGGNSNQDFFTLIPEGIIDNMEMCHNSEDYYTKNTIKLILDNFAGKDTTLYGQGYRALDSLDNLFIYITGHGKYDEGNSYINVKDINNSVIRLYDHELSGWLKDIDCSQITVVLQPCHSGGFINDIMDMTDVKCKNRAVYSSTNTEGVSFGECYINATYSPEFINRDIYDNFWCNEFTYYWSAALLGYYPIIRWTQEPPIGPWDVFENNKIGAFPWELFFEEIPTLNHEAYDISPDTNNDGIVSLDEAFIFTRNLDTWDRLGYYNPYSYSIYGDTEYPQSAYNSDFSKEFITIDGYKGTNSNNNISTGCDSKYFLSDMITLKTGTILTINDNTTLYGNGHSFINYGSVQTANDNNNSNLYNLRIESYGNDFTISNCNFIDCIKTLVANGIADIQNSTFKNTPLEIGLISSLQNYKVTSTSLIGNNFLNSVDAISINACSNVNIEDNNISAKATGIYLNNCSSHTSIFEHDKNKVSISDNNIHDCTTGLMSYSSNASICNNKIQNNTDGIILYHLSNTTISGNRDAVFLSQTQEIKNNTNYQIYTSTNSFPKMIRYNSIINNINNNYLVHSTGNTGESLELDISNNCWGALADNLIINKLYTENGYSYKYLPTWNPSPFDTANIEPEVPDIERMLTCSDSLIAEGIYNDAYNLLVEIVDYFPNTNEAKVALKSMLHLRYFTDNDYNALKEYYRTDPIILANPNITDLSDNLANKCDEILQNYDDAIEWYEDVIDDDDATYEDKVFATIDLGNLYLKMREEGNKSIGSLKNLIPKSAEQHAKTTAYLLSTLCKNNIINHNETDFNQNSCQEFIVTTNDNNIRIYHKDGNSDIFIYNSLGVVVKNTTLHEGENIINIDNLVSGIYIWKSVSSNNTIVSGKFIKK